MRELFLSYAHADGAEAAMRLYRRLQTDGFRPFIDVKGLRAGRSWQQQLGERLRASDAVLVLLTPKAVASAYVEWEWTTALFVLGKPVLPLQIATCEIPAELARLHYRDMQDPAHYEAAYRALLDDLRALPASAPPPKATYQVKGGRRIVLGNRATGVFGLSGRETEAFWASKLARLQALAEQIATEQPTAQYEAEDVEEAVIGENALGVFGAEPSRATLLQELRELLSGHERRLVDQLLASLSQLDVAMLAELSVALQRMENIALSAEEAARLLAELRTLLERVLAERALLEDLLLREEALAIAQVLGAPEGSVAHKLKLSVPIIPLLLSYEGEIALDIRTNLEALWARVTQHRV